MKIGFALWGMREKPLEEHFTFAHEMGIHALEIGAGKGDFRLSVPADPKQIEKIKELKARYDIDTTFGTIGGGYDLEDEKAVWDLVEEQKKLLEVLKLVDVKIVRIFSGWEPLETLKECQYQNMIKALREIDRYAGELGMQLAIETHGTLRKHGAGVKHLHNVSTDWNYLQRLLCDLPPHTGFLFDTGNMRAVVDGKRPLTDFVHLLKDHIIAVHIKDWVKNEDGSWEAAAIGSVDYDWNPVFEALEFDQAALIEYEDPQTLTEGMASSLTYLQELGYNR